MKISTSLIRIRNAVGVMLALSAVFAVVIGTSNVSQQGNVVLAQEASTSTVSFAMATDSVDEGDSVEVTVNIAPPLETSVDVPLIRHSSSTATAGDDFQPIPQSVTIPAGDRSAKFTVNTLEDDIDEVPVSPATGETIVIRFGTLPSGLTAAADAETVLTITDDDAAGVTISNTNLGIVEGDLVTGASYTVVLNSKPTADVTITLTPSTGLNLSGTTLEDGETDGTSVLTFTADDWNAAQTVKVTADDDAATGTVTHAVSDTGGYDDVAELTVNVTVADNDAPAMSVNPSVLMAEEGETKTYTIRLSQQPEGNVTITISGQGTEGSPNDITLVNGVTGANSNQVVFNRANWNVLRTISVRAEEDDDAVDDTAVTLTHDASDAATTGVDYDNATDVTVQVSIDENDETAIVFDQTSIDVNEGSSTGTIYRLKLASEPTADVSVSIEANTATTGVTVNPPSLTIDQADWDTWSQLIRVTASDDDANDDVTMLTHTASGGDYAGVTGTLTVNEMDDDSEGITVSRSSVDVEEEDTTSTTRSYTVELDSEPSADVTVTIDVPENSGIDLNGTGANTDLVLTFTDSAGGTPWNTPQTVTIVATDGSVAQGARSHVLTHTASNTGGYSTAITASVTVNISDDDEVGITDSSGEDADGNDTKLDVTEGPTTGAATTYTIVLDSEPTADVTITITAPEDSGVTIDTDTGTPGNQNTLTFTTDATGTTGSWADVQTVSIWVDDDIDNADNTDAAANRRDIVLTHTASDAGSEDSGYAGETETVTLAVLDNDTAAITVDPDDPATTDTETELAVTEGAAAGKTFTVVLATKPTANVIITVTGQDGTGTPAAENGLLVSPAMLTFTPDDWDDAQTVTVSAADDDDADHEADDGSEVTLTLTASGASEYLDPNGDADPEGPATATVSVQSNDDDTRGVSVSMPTIEFIEGEDQRAYTVVLDTQPSASVTVTVSSGDTGVATIQPASIVFTTSNWNVPRDVFVNPVAAGTATITNTANAAGGYTTSETASVTVTVVDDDAPGISVSPISFTVGEGASKTYTVRLSQAPTDADNDGTVDDVEVTVSGHTDTDASISGPTLSSDNVLTFTAANWNDAQTVTVMADEDDDAVDETLITLTHTANAAGGYSTSVTATVAVTITENDEAGVTVSRTSLTVDEADMDGVDYTVVLDSEPSATLTLSLAVTGTSASEVTLTSTGFGTGNTDLTFTDANWNEPRTITVTAADDADAVPDGMVTLTHTPSGATEYGTDSLASVEVTIAEDDTAAITVATDPATDPVAVEVTEGTPETGTSADYTVVLTAEPVSGETVTVTITSEDDSGVMVATGGGTAAATIDLTFDSSTYNTPQTVTVTVPGNLLAEGDRNVTLTHTASTDATAPSDVYDGQTATVTVAITDDDETILNITPTELEVAEEDPNAIAGYTVALDSEPSEDVTVTISAPEGSGLVLSETELTFTAGDTGTWSAPQRVTVWHMGPDRYDQPTGSHVVNVTHTASPGYGSMDLEVTITDNDYPAIVTMPGNLVVNEGSSATYTVELAAMPQLAGVTELTVDIEVQGSGSGVTVDPTSLTFDASNYDTPQTVTVTAADGSVMSTVTSDFDLVHTIGTTGVTFGDDDEVAAVKKLGVTVHEGDRNAEGRPVILGAPLLAGTTLMADTSAVDDPNGLGAFTHHWNRWSAPASDGSQTLLQSVTSATYTLTDADVGNEIVLSVSFTDGGGTEEVRFSLGVMITGAVVPTISQSNNVMLVDASSIDAIRATYRGISSVSYAWFRGDSTTAVSGFTGQVLPLSNNDDGVNFKLEVSFMYDSNGDGTDDMSATLTSASVAADIDEPVVVRPQGRISKIEPGIRGVTVSASDKVVLSTLIYGLQGVQDQGLANGRDGEAGTADDVTFTWTQDGRSIDGSSSEIEYTAPSSPGRYSVVASIGADDCQPNDEKMRDDACSATFTITVRRAAVAPPADPAPVNPPGEIPSVIADSDGNQYEVFTPVEGGTFSDAGYSFTAAPGAVPNGEIVGIRMSDDGAASNAGMTHQRYTLGGNMYSVHAVDSTGQAVSDYALDDAGTVCVPLPDALRQDISDLAVVAINSDGSLTILSAQVRISSAGTMVCGGLSTLPASVAVGTAGAPAAIPTPTPEPTPEAPDTGGTAPASSTMVIWALLLGIAVLALGSVLVISRRRESSVRK